MSNALAPLIRYFRACYQADYRATRLLNFLSKKVDLPYLFADEAFLAGQLITLPVDSDWGEAMQANLYLHGKEEQLYCHAFFLIGRTTVLGKVRQVCAPLFFIPAELQHKAGVYQVQLDFDGSILNPAISEVLQNDATLGGRQGSLFQLLSDELPLPPFNFEALHALEEKLRNIFPAITHPNYQLFPLRATVTDLKAGVRQQTEGFSIWPCAGLATLEKSSGTLGILNELEELSQQRQFSQVLNALFTDNKLPSVQASEEIAPLPVLLSARQEEILKSASTQTLSMVNGPPGTGKSFTIAAIAADRLSRGETVLIAAKNEQAVNVIADKLDRDFELPKIAIRANRSDYRRHLRRRLRDWLNGLGMKRISPNQMKKNRIELDSRLRQVAELEEKLEERISLDIQHQQLLVDQKINIWQRLLRWRWHRKVLNDDPLWQEQQRLDRRRNQLQEAGRTYLEALFFKRLHKAFQVYRKELQQVWEALRNQTTGKEKERYFQKINFPKLLQAMPVWLVDTDHVHEVLPLQKGLFDLVIIDEASQCDIASALPLLHRAKRAVIVGDPKQLRHVSFLSRTRQAALAKQLQLPKVFQQEINSSLSFRDCSLLDLTSSRIKDQNHIMLLDEHFRSLPALIHFSNKHFYRSQLKIMTANPSVVEERCIHIHRLSGIRDVKGVNQRECAAIIRYVGRVIRQEEKLQPELCQSIGILSPFRAQVNELRKTFKKTFTNEQLVRHRVLIGTAHDFQGEERDLIYISWCIDQDTPSGVYRYLDREDVFNVSITRARVAQFLFLSVEHTLIPQQSLLAQYLIDTGIEKPLPMPTSSFNWEDGFMEEVSAFLQAQGVETLMENYHIAGLEIDLVFVYQGKTYCIDLVGYPGPYEEAIPTGYWKMLSRLGLHPLVLPYSHWVFRRQDCEDVLRMLIQ